VETLKSQKSKRFSLRSDLTLRVFDLGGATPSQTHPRSEKLPDDGKSKNKTKSPRAGLPRCIQILVLDASGYWQFWGRIKADPDRSSRCGRNRLVELPDCLKFAPTPKRELRSRPQGLDPGTDQSRPTVTPWVHHGSGLCHTTSDLGRLSSVRGRAVLRRPTFCGKVGSIQASLISSRKTGLEFKLVGKVEENPVPYALRLLWRQWRTGCRSWTARSWSSRLLTTNIP